MTRLLLVDVSGRFLKLLLVWLSVFPVVYESFLIRPTPHRSACWFQKKLAFSHFVDDIDDDDISQHSIMVEDGINFTDTTTMSTNAASTNSTGGVGYRRIEDWNHSNRNPTHVLDSLKRDQAHWKGKFEDLGGDGI